VWLGGDATLDRLESGTFNRWVTELRESGMALNTVDGYRRCVLCIWRDAYESELMDNPPLRIKRLKKPRIVVEAFNHAEIAAILAAADKLRGYLPNGIKRSSFMRAAILVAYCSGLRRGDILRMKRSQVRDDGSVTVLQRKTGYPVRVKLSADALEAVRKLEPDDDDDRLLPWAFTPNRLQTTFNVLVKAAGVRKGSFRWLRRSAGSYAESVQPGGGARLLGHRDERMFRRHYEDHDITQVNVIEPPPIALPKIAATA
jgi:integrase